MAKGYLDLICPNDSCPGWFGPQSGPWRRHRWTAVGPLYHNMIQLPDGATRCSECNSEGVEPGAVTEVLPTEEDPMETKTHTIQLGPNVKVELTWPAALGDTLPDVELNLHGSRDGFPTPMEVVEALGGPAAFDPVDRNYMVITAPGEQDHNLTYWPPNTTAESLPTNDTAKAVKAAQEEAAAAAEQGAEEATGA